MSTHHGLISVLLKLNQADPGDILQVHVSVSAVWRVSVQVRWSWRGSHPQRLVTVDLVSHHIVSLEQSLENRQCWKKIPAHGPSVWTNSSSSNKDTDAWIMNESSESIVVKLVRKKGIHGLALNRCTDSSPEGVEVHSNPLCTLNTLVTQFLVCVFNSTAVHAKWSDLLSSENRFTDAAQESWKYKAAAFW